MKTLNELIIRCYLPVLLFAIVLFSANQLADYSDVWSHAAIGRLLIHNRIFPHTGPNMWPIKYSWIAQSWLSQLIFYACMKLGGDEIGPTLTQLLALCINALSFVLLWREWRRGVTPSLSWMAIFLVAIMGSSTRFQPRPEMFSTLCVLILLLLLNHWHDIPDEVKTGRRRIVAMAATFFAAVNLHASIVTGVALLALTVVCDFAQYHWTPQLRRLCTAAICSAFATLLNPYGWTLWAFLLVVKNPLFSQIVEWKPPFAAPPEVAYIVHSQFVLCGLSLYCWIANPRRRWAHLGWIVIAALLFLSMRRMAWQSSLIFLATMSAYPRAFAIGTLWQRGWEALLRRTQSSAAVPRIPWLAQAAVRAAALAYVLLYVINFAPPDWYRNFSGGFYPRGLTQYAIDHPRPHLFNLYENSPYLEWRLTGQPMFINIYYCGPVSFLNDYKSIAQGTPLALPLLDRYRVERVLVNRTGGGTFDSDPAKLMALLSNSTEWRRVYKGYDGEIYDRIAFG